MVEAADKPARCARCHYFTRFLVDSIGHDEGTQICVFCAEDDERNARYALDQVMALCESCQNSYVVMYGAGPQLCMVCRQEKGYTFRVSGKWVKSVKVINDYL